MSPSRMVTLMSCDGRESPYLAISHLLDHLLALSEGTGSCCVPLRVQMLITRGSIPQEQRISTPPQGAMQVEKLVVAKAGSLEYQLIGAGNFV